MSIAVQLTVLLFAIPYVGAWWWVLRLIFGKRFQPWEWIPLALLSLGVPALLMEFVADVTLGNWPAGAWAALPVPVILGWLLVRRRCGKT